MKKFILELLSVAIAGVVAFPGTVGAVKADSYYEDFPTAAEAQELSQAKNDIVYADYFHQIETLGGLFDNFSDGLSLASEEMRMNGTNNVQLGLKSKLNDISKRRTELAADLKHIDDANATKILGDYLKAINRYTAANQYLVAYYKTGTSYNFNMYIKNRSEAFDLHAYAEFTASGRYQFYIQRAYDALNNAGY